MYVLGILYHYLYILFLFFTAIDLFSSMLCLRILIFDIPRVRVGVRVKGRRVVLKKVVVRGIREIRVRRMLLVKMTMRSRSGPGNHLHDDDDDYIIFSARFQRGVNKREKALSGKSRVSHSVHSPYFTDDKQEFW